MPPSAKPERDTKSPAPTAGPTRGPAWARIDRRRFLTYVVAAPVLTVAARFRLDGLMPASARAQEAPADDVLIQITEDNRVVLQVEKAEMGQGIVTALAMLVAEELDARLADVDPRLSTAGSTFGSTSMTGVWGPVRATAAAARARLVTAAANLWSVDAATLTTGDTMVFAPDGRSATYGSLSAAAAQVTEPAVSSDPKPYAEHRVIGQPTTRLNARDIATGKAEYAMDVAVPGALATVVARPPTIRGTVASVDDSDARAMPGIVAVATIPTGVAVAAATFDQALAARDALRVTWNAGPMDSMSDADVQERLALQLPAPASPVPLANVVEGTFEFAFVSHAPMETLNAIADVRADRAEIWIGSQTPGGVISAVAAATGLATEQVTLHPYPAGGGFGRRLYHEHAVEAARISQATGHPVKLLWTRDDDTRHGRVRPASRHQIRAVHANGAVVAWDQQAASVHVEWGEPLDDTLATNGVDPLNAVISQLAWRTMTASPYDLPITLSTTEVRLPIRTGTWRAVFAGSARTVEEIVVDELAAAMGKDPVAFRVEILKSDRARAVLDEVATAGSWGRSMPAGSAQGVAVQEEFGSCTACLVELDASDPAAPRVTKAVIAVDAGLPVNPRGVEAQIMGATMDGIATVLQAGLHLDAGAIREGTFADFRWTLQKHAPVVWEIHVMPATGEPGGLGELGVPSAAGATANAWARATGTKPRRFPLVS